MVNRFICIKILFQHVSYILLLWVQKVVLYKNFKIFRILLAVYCPNPGTITNGKVYKKAFRARFSFKPYMTTIRHGDRMAFTCNKGYELRGASGATCLNGQWRPPLKNPETKCVLARHAPFPKLWLPVEEQGEQSYHW